MAEAKRALALLDLTDLSDSSTEAGIEKLCTQARTAHGPVAAVCIWPQHVALARQRLKGSTVRVATVVNFPSGGDSLSRLITDVEETLADGADDIDLVLPYRKFLAGDAQSCVDMISAISDLLDEAHILKVILETGAFPDQAKITDASRLAIDSGADFIKTSTGKISVSATLETARTMLDVIRVMGTPTGFKPAGGIRTFDDARAYLKLADDIMGPTWATPRTFRFGASSLYDALVAVIDGAPAQARKADY